MPVCEYSAATTQRRLYTLKAKGLSVLISCCVIAVAERPGMDEAPQLVKPMLTQCANRGLRLCIAARSKEADAAAPALSAKAKRKAVMARAEEKVCTVPTKTATWHTTCLWCVAIASRSGGCG